MKLATTLSALIGLAASAAAFTSPSVTNSQVRTTALSETKASFFNRQSMNSLMITEKLIFIFLSTIMIVPFMEN